MNASLRAKLYGMASDAWKTGALLLVALAALEIFEPGFVSRVFNLHFVTLFALAACLAALVLRPRGEAEKPARLSAFAQIAAVAAALAVWALLPDGLRFVWRSAAAGMTLLVLLVGVPSVARAGLHDSR